MTPETAQEPAGRTIEVVCTDGCGCPDPARERRWGDRRQELRFEIVGDVWANLEVRPAFRLLNIGEGGALIELPFPVPRGWRCGISLGAGECVARVAGVVRHVSPSEGANGSFRIGIEFQDIDAEARDHIGAVLRTARAAR